MAKKYQNSSDLNAAMSAAVERRKDQEKGKLDPKERWKKDQASKREKRAKLAVGVLVPLALASVTFCLWFLGLVSFGKPGPLADALANPDVATEVSLDSAKLGAYPEELKLLPKLEKLRLDNNGISSIPPGIGDFLKLKSLSLQYNQLSSLPAEIGKLANLEELRLMGNAVTDLPSGLTSCAKLQLLDVTDNKLTELPKDIGKLTSLTVLRAGGNSIGRLPPTFSKLVRLQELDLSGNPLTDLPDPASVPNLRKLNIRGTGIPDAKVAQFQSKSEKVSIMK